MATQPLVSSTINGYKCKKEPQLQTVVICRERERETDRQTDRVTFELAGYSDALNLHYMKVQLVLSMRKYSRLSLSRPRLSRITAYLEVKILSLFKHGNLINCSSFPQYYQYISNFRSQTTYSFVNCGCSIYCFLQFRKSDMSRYGYRGMDISKCFRESLGLRGNESRL